MVGVSLVVPSASSPAQPMSIAKAGTGHKDWAYFPAFSFFFFSFLSLMLSLGLLLLFCLI